MTVLNQAAPRVCIHSDNGNPFKVNSGKEIPIDKVLKKINDPYLLFQIERVSSFHGYLSTGAFIGIQMLNIAKRGTHSSLICTKEGDIVSFCEDVSRACSVDKAAGAALLSGRDLSNCALVTTGRLSGGMVAKVARAGIPIVVSKAASLSTGVALSKMVGMTLVAFVRNPNLYVYSGVQRIL